MGATIMAFDPSTATPVESTGGFDPSTATSIETKPTASKVANKPTAQQSAVSKLGKAFVGGTVSALDFPLSAPGFVLSTGAELATTTAGMLASPFTKETPKEAYARGAKVGQMGGEYLMNPMQKIINLFGEADAYANAALPQAMSWFSDKLQAGGKKLEETTGIPSEAVPLMGNVGMLAAGKGGQMLLDKGKAAVADATKKSATKPKPTTPEVDPIPKPPESATDAEKSEFLRETKRIDKERNANVPVVETAIKNKKTGEVTKLGPKHPEDVKAATADTHDQGFVDENGRFLDRKEAWNRAKSADQVPEGQTPERPNEGLHSGDLRKAGDERFKLADVPKEIDGIPIVEGSTKKTRADGRPVGATTRRNEDGTPKEVVIDTSVLYDQFYDQPWTKPQVEGVYPIAKDAFKTPQEWIDFVVQHEIEHTKTPEYEGQSKASYENQTNQAALKTLAEKKAAAGTIEAPTPPVGRPIETPPSIDTAVDRTKTSPRDVATEQEMYEIAADIYAKHGEVDAVKFYEGYREYQKTWAEPVAEVEKLVGTNLKNKFANDRVTNNNARDLMDMAGKDVDLEKLTYDIDKGATLTGKAQEVAAKFRTLMDELGKRALENGVIKGWHEDYVARNVVTEGAAPPTAIQEFIKDVFGYGDGVSTGGTKTTTKYGEPRRLETREDLVSHLQGINSWLASKGYDYRFKLKSDNLADIYHDYASSVEKAIENKNLITNLKQVRNVAGESLIRPITAAEPLPYGWEVMETSELAGYAIHPDLQPALKFVFDAGPGDWMKAIGAISQLTKRMNVIGSFFHAKSMMEVMSSAQIPIWTPIKEAILLPLVEKGVKAVTGKDIQLSAISKAVEQFKNGGLGDNVDQWIKTGMALGMPEDVSKGILSATGKLTDDLIGKYGPKTRVLEKSLSTVEKYTLSLFDKYTWDYLHPGGKIMVADAYLDKARRQAAEQGKPFDEVVSRKEISKFVNDSFGGLNWFDIATQTQGEFAKRMAMAAYSPEGRRALQTVLFAPDWTLSTLRAFTAALPKDLNPTKWQPVEGIKGMVTPTTKADYARLYQFKTALTYLTLLNAINMMTANRPIWDNKDATRIEWPDGTSMQAMKHAMEPYHWIADPDKTLANKLGFIPKAIIVGGAGVEYASPQADKLIDRSLTGRAEAVGKMVLPFQVQATSTAPEGEGAKRALLGTMGFPVYGQTPEQRKASKAERAKALKEAAAKYHEKAREKGWEQ
jgi:hypothetical protein